MLLNWQRWALQAVVVLNGTGQSLSVLWPLAGSAAGLFHDTKLIRVRRPRERGLADLATFKHEVFLCFILGGVSAPCRS